MKTFNTDLKEKVEKMEENELIELCKITKLCGQTIHIIFWKRRDDFEQFVLCLNYNGKTVMDGQCWHWGDYYDTYTKALQGLTYEMVQIRDVCSVAKGMKHGMRHL